MLEDIYAPPKADLTKYTSSDTADAVPTFYVVSLRKFAVLYILTLTMYQVFWLFKQWSNYKQQCRLEGAPDANIWPLPRAIFSIFFIHSLFREVAAHAAAKVRTLEWNNGSHATSLVLMLIATTVFDRLAEHSIGTPYTLILALLLMIGTFFSYRQAQACINISCGDPEGESNSRFTWANYIWIVFGSIVWLLILTGLIIGEPEA